MECLVSWSFRKVVPNTSSDLFYQVHSFSMYLFGVILSITFGVTFFVTCYRYLKTLFCSSDSENMDQFDREHVFLYI